jgi:hypothetical protein
VKDQILLVNEMTGRIVEIIPASSDRANQARMHVSPNIIYRDDDRRILIWFVARLLKKSAVYTARLLRATVSVEIFVSVANERLLFRNVKDVHGQKDATGKLFHDEIIKTAQTKGSGWVGVREEGDHRWSTVSFICNPSLMTVRTR